MGGELKTFRDVFLTSQALEGITLSMVSRFKCMTTSICLQNIGMRKYAKLFQLPNISTFIYFVSVGNM